MTDLKKLHQAAVEVRKNSHSPYSKHKVGAAILLKTGEVYTGCNVENASYGATICAERAGILKAVSERGEIKIAEVVVVTDSATGWPPCGMCLQVIAEFADSETMVHIGNLEKVHRSLKMTDVMPHGFDRKFLK